MMFLGPSGINMAEFCKRFNAQCEDEQWKKDVPVGTRTYIMSDRTWNIEIRYPTARHMAYEIAKVKKGPTFPRHETHYWSWIDVRQIYEIAKIKWKKNITIS
eukprot:UN17239